MKFFGRFLTILLMFAHLHAAEQPPAPPALAGKRAAPEEVIEQGESEKMARIEPVERVPSPLELLPLEIKEPILRALTVEKGLGKKKLYRAVANIESLRSTASIFKQALDDPAMVDYIIKELAKRYTNGSVVEAVIALASKQAEDWLHAKLMEAKALFSYRLSYDPPRAIIDAVFNDQPDVARFLLNIAYSPKSEIYLLLPGIKDNRQRTLLMAAAKLADTKILQRMLNDPRIILSQNFINAMSDEDQTALSYAIMSGNMQNVDLLLNAGAHTVWEDPQEGVVGAALVYAAKANNLELVERFLQYPDVISEIDFEDGSKKSALSYAIEYDNYAMFQKILAAYGELNPESGYKFLYNAIRKRNTQMIEDLLKKGLNPDGDNENFPIYILFETDEQLNNPLFNDQEALEILKILIKYGVDVNNIVDASPLVEAIGQSKYQTIAALLAAGANPNQADQDGTPLWHAQRLETNDKERIIDLLKRYGAKE